jgi:hypothetical protein
MGAMALSWSVIRISPALKIALRERSGHTVADAERRYLASVAPSPKL